MLAIATCAIAAFVIAMFVTVETVVATSVAVMLVHATARIAHAAAPVAYAMATTVRIARADAARELPRVLQVPPQPAIRNAKNLQGVAATNRHGMMTIGSAI